ncbi:MAG: peroxiredoxin, partial [Pseudomonadota bacterium]
GLSTQAVDYLGGEVARLHLPFPLISDSALVLREALQLPLLDVPAGVPAYYRRITLILRAGRIVKVFYPVFPPDKNAEQVLAWLQAHPG